MVDVENSIVVICTKMPSREIKFSSDFLYQPWREKENLMSASLIIILITRKFSPISLKYNVFMMQINLANVKTRTASICTRIPGGENKVKKIRDTMLFQKHLHCFLKNNLMDAGTFTVGSCMKKLDRDIKGDEIYINACIFRSYVICSHFV